MNPRIRNKILVIFVALVIGWLFIRIAKLLIPLVIIAVIGGYIWEWVSKDKYDNY